MAGGGSGQWCDALHDELRRAVAAHLPAAVALRRELHTHPEVSGAEGWTAERVSVALPALDCRVVAGTGRLVRVSAGERPVVIRAELDALPVHEQTGAPFASANGAMHACGHDVHLAALVAVAHACADVASVPLLALLQPREERSPSGARDVVESGALVEEGARAVVAVHVNPAVPSGTVAVDPGVVNAGSDELEIAMVGRGGHGGYPHLARDPVPALCEAVGALAQAVRGTVGPLQPAAVSIGVLEAGAAPNVISSTARAAGTIRTFFPDDRARLHARIEQVVSSVAAAHGCTGEATIVEVEPPLRNDPALTVAARTRLSDGGVVLAPEFRSCGADDFSFYGDQLPSLMAFLGTSDRPPAAALADGDRVSLHDPRFLPPDDAVRQVAEVMIGCLVAALEGEEPQPGERPGADLRG